MESSLDDFFISIPEPHRSAFLFLRKFFMTQMNLTEAWKFNTPFYYHNRKWFGYISYNRKKEHEIYVAFVKGSKVSYPKLESEGRKQMKIYRINAFEDIDVKALTAIVNLLKEKY